MEAPFSSPLRAPIKSPLHQLVCQVKIADMPFDAAVYHPGRNSIFAVRGGRIFECDAGSGAILGLADFNVYGFSPSCICYDAANDRLWASCWNQDHGDALIAGNKRWFARINPATLVVETLVDIGMIWVDSGFRQSGVTDAFVVNGYVVFVGWCLSFMSAQINCGMFSTTSPGALFASQSGFNMSSLIDRVSFAFDPGAGRLWMGFATGAVPGGGNGLIWPVDVTFGGSPSMAVNIPYVTAPPNTTFVSEQYGMAFNTATGKIYMSFYSGGIERFSSGMVREAVLLAHGDPYKAALNVRYNATTNKVYAACVGGQSVAVIDCGAGDAVTVKTGFDLPFNIVCTPTKTFAVQQGGVGLKEIV
jgi:hypothetical protein